MRTSTRDRFLPWLGFPYLRWSRPRAAVSLSCVQSPTLITGKGLLYSFVFIFPLQQNLSLFRTGPLLVLRPVEQAWVASTAISIFVLLLAPKGSPGRSATWSRQKVKGASLEHKRHAKRCVWHHPLVIFPPQYCCYCRIREVVQAECGACCRCRDGCWGIDPSEDESQGDAQRKPL